MKKITFTIAAILGFSSLAVAQDLYVSPNSYMYVQDEVVFVNDDIRLEETTSNLYLRDNAQLIQNTNTKNWDIGELSVYQTPTTDIYNYNYWCSPVGVGTQGSQGDAPFNRTTMHQPNSLTLNETATTEYGITYPDRNSTSTTIATHWLWQTVNSDGYNNWVEARTNDVLAGRGYTMKGRPTGDTNKVIDFRGRPNTGDFSIPVAGSAFVAAPGNISQYDGLYNGQVESLIGNPYPSSMDMKLFFANANNQLDLDGAIYYWEQTGNTHMLNEYNGGYASWIPGNLANPADHGTYTRATFKTYHDGEGPDTIGEDNQVTGVNGYDYNLDPFNRRYAAIGQGFMVRSSSTGGGNVVVNNSMRVYIKHETGGNDDVFGRAAEGAANNSTVIMSANNPEYQNEVSSALVIPTIQLHTKINDEYYRENVIAFRENTNSSYQKFTDGRLAEKLNTDVYLLADDNMLSIKSIAYDIEASIPFGIDVRNNASTFSVTVHNLLDVSDNVDIYMFDKVNDTYTDIKNGVFDVTLDAGTHNDRFEVVFKDASQEQEELDITEEEVVSSFNVYQNNTNSELTIKNPKAYIIKSVMMFDVTGKVIYNKTNLGNNELYTFPTSALSNGMYLTKVTTDQDFEVTKKVMVQN